MVECPTCNGTCEEVVGYVHHTFTEPGYAVTRTCRDCGGVGAVPMHIARSLDNQEVPPYDDLTAPAEHRRDTWKEEWWDAA